MVYAFKLYYSIHFRASLVTLKEKETTTLAAALQSSSATFTQSEVRREADMAVSDRGQPSSLIIPVETSGGKSSDANCCYLRMRDSAG